MEHLPPWLRNVPLPARSPDLGGPAVPPPAAGDDEMPSWLVELQGEVAGDSAFGAPSEDSPPDWLADLAAPGAAEDAASAQAGPSAEPPWLSEPPAGEPPTDHDQRDEQSTSSRVKMPVGATDWLRSIGSDPDARSEPLSEPISTPDDQAGVPDWLRDLSAEDVARGIEADLPDSQPRFDPHAPGWLAEDLPSPDASTVSANFQNQTPAGGETGDQASWGAGELGDAGAEEAPAPRQDEGEAADLAASVEMPAWLRDLGEAPPSAAEPPVEDEPAWLRDAANRPSTDRLGAADEVDIPSWLRGDDESGPSDKPPSGRHAGDAGEGETAGVEELPPWLREAAAPAEGPAGPAWSRAADADEGEAAGAEELPSWLREAEQSAEGGPAEDVPAWLQDERAAEGAPAEDVPAWLAADDISGSSGEEAPPGATAEPSLPAWLRGVADEAPPASATGQPEAPAPPLRAAASADQGDSHSFLGGAELPSWLRVPEPERPTDPGEGQALDWLRRLGGSEQDEEVQAAAVSAMAVPRRPQYERSAAQLAAVDLLQRISRTPYPQPEAPAAPAPLSRWQRIGLDRILYGLLALALVIALLVPAVTGPFQTTTPTAPGAAGLEELLAGLGGDDVALVAYEWGAQRSGELRPLEAAVADRLIANRVKLILVSTDLQGTLLSFDLIGPLRAAGYNNEDGVSFGGRDYVLLGYRPGGELALRGLAQNLRGELRSDFDGQDATQGLVANNPDGTPRFTGIGDLSMILVLADQPQDVQAWMEQVHPAARDVPIVFLLPQEAQPLAQPYLRMPNVYHLAGQQGALALRASDPAGDLSVVAGATGRLWYAVTVFLVLLVLGAVVAVFTRGRPAGGGAA